MIKECDYKILDGLVSKDEQDNFETLVTSQDFAWYLQNATVKKDVFEKHKTNYPNIIETPQLCHTFCHLVNDVSEINSDFYQYAFNLFNPLVTHFQLNNLELFRVKANLQMKCSNNTLDNHNTPHIDNDVRKHYVAIYYVNESDGNTILFNEDYSIKVEVKPKKGRFLVFNGSILHTGSNPINTDKRIVVNYNFNERILKNE
jgi:hypothetical protein